MQYAGANPVSSNAVYRGGKWRIERFRRCLRSVSDAGSDGECLEGRCPRWEPRTTWRGKPLFDRRWTDGFAEGSVGQRPCGNWNIFLAGSGQWGPIGWPLLDDLSDEALEARLFPASTALAEIRARRPQPHWPTIHRELRRPGVTLQLVWEEHRAAHPEGYGPYRSSTISIRSRRWLAESRSGPQSSRISRSAFTSVRNRRAKRPSPCANSRSAKSRGTRA